MAVPDPVDARLAQVAAVLVEDRILRRVIKRHRRLRGIGLQVPHAECYSLPRADLEKLVDRDELRVDLAQLPERVALDLDPDVLLAASRPPGAPERPHVAPPERQPSAELAEAAERDPVAHAVAAELAERLAHALGIASPEPRWIAALVPLAATATRQ